MVSKFQCTPSSYTAEQNYTLRDYAVKFNQNFYSVLKTDMTMSGLISQIYSSHINYQYCKVSKLTATLDEAAEGCRVNEPYALQQEPCQYIALSMNSQARCLVKNRNSVRDAFKIINCSYLILKYRCSKQINFWISLQKGNIQFSLR